MPHLDSARLVLLALGEGSPAPAEAEHLASCAACRAEFDSLVEVAGLGRETRDLQDLPAPPDRVWDLIAAGTGIDAGTRARADAGTGAGEPAGTRDRADAGLTTVDNPAPVPAPAARRPVRRATTGPRSGAGPGRRTGRPGWRRTALVAAAAAVLAVLVTVGLGGLRTDDGAVTERADLAAYGTTPASAHGQASVLRRDGTEVLRLHVANLPAEPGYYEVWLIDPDTQRMFSIGILGGQSDVDLPLPSSVDLKDYRLVDVSAELYDGNAAHSGHSLLRGSLKA